MNAGCYRLCDEEVGSQQGCCGETRASFAEGQGAVWHCLLPRQCIDESSPKILAVGVFSAKTRKSKPPENCCHGGRVASSLCLVRLKTPPS